MRRIITLLLLFGTMQLVLPIGGRGHGGKTLLVFGFLILVAYTMGEFADALRAPRIVGYMAAGVLFGPSLLNIVTLPAAADLAPVSGLAIALIAFLAGAELRWEEVRSHGVAVLKILSTELTLTFLALTMLLIALARFVPFLDGTTGIELPVIAALFASMAMVHSPAVTMAVLSETGARGPVARTTLSVVLLSDITVVLAFSAVLAVARSVAPPSGATGGGLSLGALAWEILGAVLVGAILGGAVALYLRFVRGELALFAVLVTLAGSEIARLLHVETLLTLLIAGFVTENLSRHGSGEALRGAMERSAAPVFVVFFALAGTEFALKDLAVMWPLVLPIVVVRAAAIWGGTRLGARWARVSDLEARYTWMGLVSQAGVAVGLAVVLANAYPSRGAEMRDIFLATLALNEAVGPILFRRALARSNELTPAGNVAPVAG